MYVSGRGDRRYTGAQEGTGGVRSMLPKIIEYKVEGNLLKPLVYVDLSLLIEEYDSFMINIKRVTRKKRGA
jgi:hypothetical protein